MTIDKLNEFDVLTGFRFVEAHEQTAEWRNRKCYHAAL